LVTDSSNPKRHRRRLRSRIIISFLLFGTVLTALFAAAAIYLRSMLEDRIIVSTLKRELTSFVEYYRTHPGDPNFPFQRISGKVVGPSGYANLPFNWRDRADGVYRIVEDSGSGPVAYQLAVKKDADLTFFLRYDVSREETIRQRLGWFLILGVIAFSALSWVLGIWSASRVMSPVADLAKRITRMSRRGKPEPLAMHFANDEVGQLASTLDDYAARLTALVERDREFNSDVSHELRTPLAVIQSTTELMLNMQDLPEKAKQRLARIERSAKHSTELITALLHLSRGEKQHPTDGEFAPVHQLLPQIVDAHRTHLLSKPVQVNLEIEGELNVNAPEAVISVVLGNLIGNAFKYTAEGEVTIRLIDSMVEVADSGPGIPAEEQSRVFERHFRGSSGGGSGAGLGLSIVRRLCELHGWKVSLEPREPHGMRAVLRFH
jgi:signal transduction histidine kinase